MISGKTSVAPSSDTKRDPLELLHWLAGHKINELFAPNLIIDGLCEAAIDTGLVPTALIQSPKPENRSR